MTLPPNLIFSALFYNTTCGALVPVISADDPLGAYNLYSCDAQGQVLKTL